VYADYVCPFCYIEKVTMERYRDGVADPPPVEWRPFDLQGHKRGPDGEIDESVDDGKDEAYFERAKENVRKLQERHDVEMGATLLHDVDSWNAHQVALFVREERGDAAFRRLHDRLFEALWQDGADVGDPEILRGLATEVDLEPDVVDRALTEEWSERLAAQFERAREAGVTGVPTFVYGEHAARGAIPPEQFERLVEG